MNPPKTVRPPHADFRRWSPATGKGQDAHAIVGEVVASNERAHLIRELRGTFYQLQNDDFDFKRPRRVGGQVYVYSKSQEQRGVLITLQGRKLLAHPERFGLMDHILGAIDLRQAGESTWLTEQLRDRAATWYSRGVHVGSSFEKNARRWCQQCATLDVVQQRLYIPAKPLRRTDEQVPARYDGKIVALGTHDLKGHIHVIVEHRGELLAFQARRQQLVGLKVGQPIEVRPDRARGKTHTLTWTFVPSRGPRRRITGEF